MGFLWCALEDPVPLKMLISLVTAVLSVHCLYQNAFLLFALCMGGAAVGLYRRRWKLVLFPLGIGAIAALSVLPYYAIVTKTGAWNMVVKEPVSLPLIVSRFKDAIDPAGLFISWIWLVLCLLVIVVFIRTLAVASRVGSGGQKALILYLLVTMLVGVASYLVFIKILSYPTQAWYYLPLMAMIAVTMDKGVDAVCERYTGGRWVRIVCILVAGAFVFVDSWNTAHVRRTNMDLLAATVESIAKKDDFIVVFSFAFGISFDHYYKGATEWATLPDMDDHSVHRFDLFKERMMQEEPIKPVIDRMLQTLKAGNRVWLVGPLTFLRQGEKPAAIAPAPHSPHGWNGVLYHTMWSKQAVFALLSHGQTLRSVRMPAEGPVSGFETAPLLVAQGWRP